MNALERRLGDENKELRYGCITYTIVCSLYMLQYMYNSLYIAHSILSLIPHI